MNYSKSDYVREAIGRHMADEMIKTAGGKGKAAEETVGILRNLYNKGIKGTGEVLRNSWNKLRPPGGPGWVGVDPRSLWRKTYDAGKDVYKHIKGNIETAAPETFDDILEKGLGRTYDAAANRFWQMVPGSMERAQYLAGLERPGMSLGTKMLLGGGLAAGGLAAGAGLGSAYAGANNPYRQVRRMYPPQQPGGYAPSSPSPQMPASYGSGGYKYASDNTGDDMIKFASMQRNYKKSLMAMAKLLAETTPRDL